MNQHLCLCDRRGHSRISHPIRGSNERPVGATIYMYSLLRFFSFDSGADFWCSQTDPLGALLTKHVPTEQRPRRDVVGEYAGRDVHEMVVSCLRRVSFSIRHASISFIFHIFSRHLHHSHKHSHFSSVSRICTRSFIILISLSLLLSVRVSNPPQLFTGGRSFSVLYLRTVAKYY